MDVRFKQFRTIKPCLEYKGKIIGLRLFFYDDMKQSVEWLDAIFFENQHEKSARIRGIRSLKQKIRISCS